ncbi:MULTISPECIES: hypothetical protein [Flavobacterium]|uniref:hypothetical protein n=1 Tax=Flavobacterium TaxID=237 RepID=UPI001FCB9AED|nr:MULTISPECIES: hypothetical protein [Flavobacterium]UOK42144.1 hypothetical protein LZF87_12595 [Flavobacterium enshiense]
MPNFLLLLIIFFSFSVKTYSQNERDKEIKEKILPFLNSESFYNKTKYDLVKKDLNELAKKYGYETDLQTRLLNASFHHKDTLYFKAQLSILVEKFGYDIRYTSNKELYYYAITEGNMSSWFKKMYIKNHGIWLENNFEKLIDLHKLNQLQIKDQIINKFASKIYFSSSMSSEQKEIIQKELNSFNLENISELNSIAQKIDYYPNSKRFAVIQNGFQSLLIHNFQQKITMDKTWEYLFPLIKKSYLKFDLDNTIFQNYDFYSYLNNGYQEFNSYTIKDIPIQLRKNENEIPLKSIETFNKIKKEFNW